jgi:alkylhydroperoxidase family enzyme
MVAGALLPALKGAAMPRIDPPRAEDVQPDVLPTWLDFYRKRGNVPNMFRTLALRPELMRALSDCMAAIMGPGTVSVRLKELVVVRVSQLNGCKY